MSLIAQFAGYAAAFEKAYESDDWSLVEPFFTEDAVYVVGLEVLRAEPCKGRDEILAYFKQVLDRFDRRFESRELNLLEGPVEEDDSVWIRGTATYCAPGVPDFVLELKEILRFEGDRICHLEDQYTPEMRDDTLEYIQEHAGTLGVQVDS